jgi:hypothetical protein
VFICVRVCLHAIHCFPCVFCVCGCVCARACVGVCFNGCSNNSVHPSEDDSQLCLTLVKTLSNSVKQ